MDNMNRGQPDETPQSELPADDARGPEYLAAGKLDCLGGRVDPAGDDVREAGSDTTAAQSEIYRALNLHRSYSDYSLEPSRGVRVRCRNPVAKTLMHSVLSIQNIGL